MTKRSSKVRICYVYIMKPTERLKGQKTNWLYIKVGNSFNPKNRRSQLQTGLPIKLEILNTYEYAFKKEAKMREKDIHDKYERYKTTQGGTEWLYVPRWILNEIQLDLMQVDHTSRSPWKQLALRLLYRLVGGRYTEHVENNSAD